MAVVLGTVVSIDDPTYSGRIKVRVPGYHDNIPDSHLPWCQYGGSSMWSANGGGSISIARVGQKVRVRFNDEDEDATSMEWYATNRLDKSLINELKSDYEGAHVLLYDSAIDLSLRYQSETGFIIYYAGSFIQMTPDGNITIHYGEGATGTQIQLSDGRIDIQAPTQINITTAGTLNLEADNIVMNAKSGMQQAGSSSAEAGVNGVKLMTALTMLAEAIDMKTPQSPGITAQTITSMKESILNQDMQYFENENTKLNKSTSIIDKVKNAVSSIFE